MSSQLEPYQDTLGDREVLNTAVNLAKQICSTEFVPAAMRDKPDKVMAAMLIGRELGLGPMTALNHINIINGRGAIDSALKQGKAEQAGARFRVVEMTDERCVIHAWPAGDTGQPVIVTWSMKDATRAGLTNKGGPWKTYPRKMLFRRAMSEACDVVAGAAILGLPPTLDEITDGYDDTPALTPAAPTSASQPAAKRTVQRRSINHDWSRPADPEPLPTFDDEPATDTAEIVDAEIVDNVLPLGVTQASDKQVKRALAIMRGQGIGDDDRHALVSVASSGRTERITELTSPEISALMDNLEQAAQAR